MSFLKKKIPLPLIGLLMVTALLVGAYAPGYVWKVNYKIDQLTSFEICELKTTGDTHADQIPIRCFHVDPEPPVPLPTGLNATISESAAAARFIQALSMAIMEGNETIAGPTLTIPGQIQDLAASLNGTVVQVPANNQTNAERAAITQGAAAGMQLTVIAIQGPNGRLIGPSVNRYHEFIRADQKLRVFFFVPVADRTAAAAVFEELFFVIHIFNCVTGFEILGSPIFLQIVQSSHLPGLGMASIDLNPGMYCVIKQVWYSTGPIKGTVAGMFSVIITALVLR